MPPRKRARLNANVSRESTTPVRESPAKSETPNYIPAKFSEYTEALSNVQHDPWTDEEETLLFKSLVRWKPTGIHKHFRMLSIFEEFRSHGYIASSRGPPAHLRIPGIWAKLYTLYDLDALDQRENAHDGYGDDTSSDEENEDDDDDDADNNNKGGQAENSDEDDEEDSAPEPPRDFELPDQNVADPMDFGDLMWKRRILEKPDEQFSGPELVKGLSRTRTLPGAKLSGVSAVGAGSRDAAAEEVKVAAEDEEEEGEDEEDEEENEDEEGDEDEENESEDEAEDDEEGDEEGDGGGSGDEEEEEESGDDIAEDTTQEAATSKTVPKSKATRGAPKTRGKQEPPRRRGTRRR